jgi:predicted DNA-binding transcriptional regulator YafY
MRADRLVAVLLLLQRRGKVTVNEIAEELEIAPRTARRDLEALAIAGLPVYSTAGRGGGWQLAGSGRTDLSGLNAAEVQALFTVAGSEARTTPELRAALRKLVRALPESFRTTAEIAASSTLIDPRRWGQADRRRAEPPMLEVLQRAVIEARQVRMQYVARGGERTERLVEPLGVACKGSTWYLVADTDAGLRTFRIDRVIEAEPTGIAATRPDGFDLSTAWDKISDHVEQLRAPLVATLVVDPGYVHVLRWIFGPRLTVGAPVDGGRVEAELRASRMEELAGDLAGFSSAVEVVAPAELRQELRRIGAELLAAYGP